MPRHVRSPLTASLELAMEDALRPDGFVARGAIHDLVAHLELVRHGIDGLTGGPSSPDAVRLYETLIAACHEKTDDLDDSDGDFGRFVGELFLYWVKARQAAGAAPDETVEQVLAWVDHDDYGFAAGLDREVAKVLDAPGLSALERAMEARLRQAGREGGAGRAAAYVREESLAVLKCVAAARGDVEGYLARCGQAGPSPADCEVLAEICRQRRDLEGALAWVERGLARPRRRRWGEREGLQVESMRRDLLRALGRSEEAVASAWKEFERRPSPFTWETLERFIPKGERSSWRDKAIAAAAHARLGDFIGLGVAAKARAPLAARIARARDAELEGISHYTTEPAAELLRKEHPAVAARVYRALGLRIVKARKSRYYDAAIENLRKARDCYAQAGLAADWATLVAEIRRDHSRLTWFIQAFERVVAGGDPLAESSLLVRARARWDRTTRRADEAPYS